MHWVTIIWSMFASACLTLATIYLLTWWRSRANWGNLFFCLMAGAVAWMAFTELRMMRADSPQQFGMAVRWIHPAVWVLMLGLVGFVRVHLRAGRSWLGWIICAYRTIVVVLSFSLGQSIHFLVAPELRHVSFLGEIVAFPHGGGGRWAIFADISLIVWIAFIVDASIAVWRRGDRWQAVVVGGGFLTLSVGGSLHSALVVWGVLQWPVMMSPFLFCILGAMGWELARSGNRLQQLAEELCESQAQVALATEAAGVGVWIWDTVSNEVRGSDQWMSLFGFSAGQAVTFEMVIERIHPEDRDRVTRGVQAAMTRHADYTGEYRIVWPDNSQRWGVARGRVTTGASCTTPRMIGVTIDITERKQTELAMAESEQRYRMLFDTAPAGIALIGPDGRFTAVNVAQAQYYGYESPEQLVGFDALLCVSEKDRERVRANMLGLLGGEERPARRYTAVRRDGSEFLVEVTSSPLRHEDGTLQGYLCVTRDITESEQTQSALKESIRRFRQVAEIAGEFIWETDGRGLYTYASPSVQAILGYTPEEMVGKVHFYDLFAPSVREALKAEAFQLFHERQTFRRFPNSNVSKSGRTVHMETSASPIVSGDGILTGYRGVDLDVTARKHAEQEIRNQRDQLAHLSRVNMLGELAGALAHELNQPLTAILSNVQATQRFLASDNADFDEIREILADVVTDVQRAGEIIRRLRPLLKKGEADHLPVDVNELVADTLKLVRSDLLNHGIILVTEFAPGLPIVAGDRVQIQQVLLNLIMNSSDAMAQCVPEQRRLCVRTELFDPAHVRVLVSDRGTGILADAIDQVFEPFYTTKSEGIGLGLRVCQTIIASHGGTIAACNNADRGATFSFTLPVAPPAPHP